jgi:beta-alanine degradation protein BauB
MVDDRPARPAAERTVQLDDDRVRVSEWRFAPDAATGATRTSSTPSPSACSRASWTSTTASGRTMTEPKATGSDVRPAGVEHDVVDQNGHELAFVEIELKDGGSG